jgi:hypothetical protein
VRVIGVLESKGATFSSTDDGAVMPLTAMQQTMASRGRRGATRLSSVS